MTERVWVNNAYPLILLGKLNQLDLLAQLAPSVVVPCAVCNEIAQGQQDPATPRTLAWARKHAQPDLPVPVSILNWDIGAGESRVLGHCLRIENSKAILDDGEARAAAESHGIPTHGTLGMILRARKRGLIPSARRLSAHLLRNALESVGEATPDRMASTSRIPRD